MVVKTSKIQPSIKWLVFLEYKHSHKTVIFKGSRIQIKLNGNIYKKIVVIILQLNKETNFPNIRREQIFVLIKLGTLLFYLTL